MPVFGECFVRTPAPFSLIPVSGVGCAAACTPNGSSSHEGIPHAIYAKQDVLRWTLDFLEGRHPWKRQLAVLARAEIWSNEASFPVDVQTLAEGLLLSPRAARRLLEFRYLPPPTRSDGPLPSLPCPPSLLYLRVFGAEGTAAAPHVTSVRYFRGCEQLLVQKARARLALSELTEALAEEYRRSGTFLGLVCVNGRFSRILCAGYSIRRGPATVFRTQGPLFILEVSPRSGLEQRSASLDRFCQLDVYSTLAYELTHTDGGEARRHPSTHYAYDADAVQALWGTWADGLSLAAALPTDRRLQSLPPPGPAFLQGLAAVAADSPEIDYIPPPPPPRPLSQYESALDRQVRQLASIVYSVNVGRNERIARWLAYVEPGGDPAWAQPSHDPAPNVRNTPTVLCVHPAVMDVFVRLRMKGALDDLAVTV